MAAPFAHMISPFTKSRMNMVLIELAVQLVPLSLDTGKETSDKMLHNLHAILLVVGQRERPCLSSEFYGRMGVLALYCNFVD